MTNFKSKELNRTFESIMFIEKISKEPFQDLRSNKATSPGSSSRANITKKDINISPAPGGIRISELYSGKESFAGKTVKIKGQVTKFSPEIMGTNWIHIQDGTESEGNYDLTVTSNSVVNVGDTVTVEGSITLNKDLGYGYFFDVIMENAVIK
jgi:adenylate cyclase